jgi:hypothetical protein
VQDILSCSCVHLNYAEALNYLPSHSAVNQEEEDVVRNQGYREQRKVRRCRFHLTNYQYVDKFVVASMLNSCADVRHET